MAITPGDYRRGHLEGDGHSDTHGFRLTGKRIWVVFAHDGDDRWHRRKVWVDHLGDWYVEDYGGGRFAHLEGYGETAAWEWVDEEHPTIPPREEMTA